MPDNPQSDWLSTEERERFHISPHPHVAPLIAHADEADRRLAGARENAESLYVQLGGGDEKLTDAELYFASSRLIKEQAEKLKEREAEIAALKETVGKLLNVIHGDGGQVSDILRESDHVNKLLVAAIERNQSLADEVTRLREALVTVDHLFSILRTTNSLNCCPCHESQDLRLHYQNCAVRVVREALAATPTTTPAASDDREEEEEIARLRETLEGLRRVARHQLDSGCEDSLPNERDALRWISEHCNEALAATPATIKEKANAD